MSDFIVEKLTKSVGDKTVFKEISFIIHDLDRIGIIGVNGTGKTTLLDVVSERIGFDGDVSPFTKANGYKIAYLTQEPEFDDSKTVLDTVLSSDLREMALIREYETLMADYSEENQARLEKVMAEMASLDAWSIESEVKTVLSKLGLSDLSQKVGDLSGGLRRRVQLAQVLLNDADLLLLDEPTNHLDIDTIAWLTNFLKSSKKTVLFITHDRYFLDNVATRIFELDQANLIEYQGNYQDYVRLKAEQDERDAAALHKKKQLYKQELAWMRTQPQARATKQQARINRFKDLKGEVHQTVNNDDLEINFETSRIGKKVVNFEHVDFAYEDGKQILSDFNLIMQNRDRIGIVGDNGVGKSTLLNLINGDLVPTAGVLDIGETVRIGYFSQQIKDMDESKRVINYLQEVADEVKTTDLDIATLTVLENFLNGFGGPVVTVSHDRYFLDKVANKILAFEEGGVREFFGNYTDYLDEKAFLQEQAALLEKEKEQASVKVEKVKEDKKRMSYFEKQEWATIEDEIADLEAKIEEIEAAMLENASDYGQLATLQRDLDAANETLLEKYERYEYLSELEG